MSTYSNYVCILCVYVFYTIYTLGYYKKLWVCNNITLSKTDFYKLIIHHTPTM